MKEAKEKICGSIYCKSWKQATVLLYYVQSVVTLKEVCDYKIARGIFWDANNISHWLFSSKYFVL